MKVVFEDPQFSFQLLRILGAAEVGQADVGECLSTAHRIKEGEYESWCGEWSKTARRVHAIADGCAAAGHAMSAADTYFRASNYYRAAEFYLHGDPSDPRIIELSRGGRDCFAKALRLGGTRFETLEIPYEGTLLPGIFYPAGASDRPAGTLILHTGFDGTLEELMPWGIAAVRRGLHCLTFEGPGQGRVIREQRLPFRPDWEQVVRPVVDCAVARPDVDRARIALMGLSFGGYLAPRAAAFETRLACCIANGGVFDFLGSQLPPGTNRREYRQLLAADPASANRMLGDIAKANSDVRWAVANGMYTFGASSPAEWLLKAMDYDLSDVAGSIRCPTLVIDTENETAFRGQARKLYDALACPKTWMLFTAEDGAEDHCQVGSPALSQQRILDWLEETLAAPTKTGDIQN